MIRLEYDVQKAGTRVSFVVCDVQKVESSSSDILLRLGKHVGDTHIVPQTVETLDAVAHLLSVARRYEEETTQANERYEEETTPP